MKVALLCDVDQSVYHVGDEAIASMSTARLRARGHEVLRLSRREKYGPGGEEAAGSLPALVFPWPLEERALYLDEIRRVLAGERDALPPEDKLFSVIEQMRGADALVIGGGGSLTSRFGWLLDERLATALVARHLGLPVVLSGQSLGPELTPPDRESARELLELCTLVGLRDAHSARLARELCPDHPALLQSLDDALGLGATDDGDAPGADPDPGLLSVTLGGDGDPLPWEDYAAVATAVVEALALRTGARVELVPHMADPDLGGGDLDLHEEVARRLSVPATALPLVRDTEAAARTAAAGWVVTTRFHPVVFAVGAGSSVLALPLNRYGIARMDGALRNVGLAGGVVPFAALWDPTTGGPSSLIEPVVDALIEARVAEQQHLRTVRPRLLAAAESWWDRICETLQAASGTGTPVPADPVPPDGAGPEIRPRWDAVLRTALDPWSRGLGGARVGTGRTPDGPEAVAPDASVAVIMRTQDRPAMLDRALQDVLAQTRQDWELVIVDDAGNRAAVDEVAARHHVEGDGRIRVLHRTRSAGMEAASNHGLGETSAAAVVVHDDDDTWHPTFLQETLAHLRAHPEHEAVVVRTMVVHERETPAGVVEEEAFPYWQHLSGARLLDYLAINRSVPIAMLHRRRVHETAGLYDESLPVVGDHAFHLEILRRFEVGFLDRPLAHWRQRPTARGAASNSMYSAADAHRHYDAELRERHLRAWVAENGLGLPLFMSYNTESHLARSEERLLAELGALREEVGRLHARLEHLETPGAGRRARTADRIARRAATEARRAIAHLRRG